MTTLDLTYKPDNLQPTGNFKELQCGNECKLLRGRTLALKELKDDNGRIAYGVVIPLFNKTLALLIPPDSIDFPLDDCLDDALTRAIWNEIRDNANEVFDGFVPIRA